MGNCCGRGPNIVELIEEKLREIRHVFPTMTVAALLQPDGEVIACVAGGDGTPSSPSSHNGGGNGAGTGAGKLSDELIATILTFRKTAASFGATLQHQESPVIHVRGKATLFSCYDIDKHVLAFYSAQEPTVALVDVNVAGATDDYMLPLLNDLRVLIYQLNQAQGAKKHRKR